MESEEVVTIQKPKNPGRVEWGKKLGKISKERKLKKQEEKDENIVVLDKYNSYKLYMVGVPIIAAVLGAGYILYKTKYTIKPQQQKIIEVPKYTPKYPDF